MRERKKETETERKGERNEPPVSSSWLVDLEDSPISSFMALQNLTVSLCSMKYFISEFCKMILSSVHLY